MDHLPLPVSLRKEPSRVVYLCDDDDPYDAGDYSTWPIRSNWPELLSSLAGTPLWLASRHIEIIEDKRLRLEEKLLTQWIFFGLLYVALSPFQLYNAPDYITNPDNESIRWLHTKTLKNTLLEWNRKIQEYDLAERDAYILELRKCLNLAQEALLALQADAYKNFDRMIKSALLAVCSTVDGMTLPWLNANNQIPIVSRTVTLDEIGRQELLDHGWCPSEIAHLQHRGAPNRGGLRFAEHLLKNVLNEDHSDCTDHACERLQIKKGYRPKHVSDDCQCTDIGPDHAVIIKYLKQGYIPLLEVTEDAGTLTLQVHPQELLDDNSAYVAISHVWADGLGNPDGMWLPKCQVSRMNHLVQQIKSHTFFRGKRGKETEIPHKHRLLFWCDTLCCPVELENKVLALDRMRDVYERSEYTLVLDRELRFFNYEEIGVVEAGWRIVNSRWERRLWTFQEAGLPLRLLIQFKDRPVSLYPLMQTLAQMFRSDPQRERLLNTLCAEMVMLRQWKHSDGQKPWVSEAAMAIAHRDVSVSADEALCVGTVLDLDNSRLARSPSHQRMALLWRLICQHERGIRDTVIFNGLGRMSTAGFRWAPASFLQPVGNELDYISLERDEDGKAVLLDRGLRVRRAGWHIRLVDRPKGIPNDLCPVSSPEHNIVPVLQADGTCYNILKLTRDGIPGPQNSLLNTLSDSSKEWYLILSKQGTFEHVLWTSQQKALLASKEQDERGLPYFHSYMVVHVDRLPPRQELPRRIVYLYSQSLLRSWTVAALGVAIHLHGLVDSILAGFLPNSTMTWFDAKLKVSSTILRDHLVNLMWMTDPEALKLTAAAKMWSEGGGRRDTHKLGGHIISFMTGRYANVVETLDSSTEWVVD